MTVRVQGTIEGISRYQPRGYHAPMAEIVVGGQAMLVARRGLQDGLALGSLVDGTASCEGTRFALRAASTITPPRWRKYV